MGQLSKDEVFALAVQRYSDTVFRAAMHNCSCTADAEDVVQDVFEKLLNYSGRFESEEHLKAWLLRVAINRCHPQKYPGQAGSRPARCLSGGQRGSGRGSG